MMNGRMQIKIGDKPSTYYVLASLEILQRYNRVTILAMGKKISKAVSVAEITKRELRKMDFFVKESINISSKEVEDGRDVSCIEIKIEISELSK